MNPKRLSKVSVIIHSGEAAVTFVVDAPRAGHIQISHQDNYMFVQAVGPEGHMHEEVRIAPHQSYMLQREYFS